MMGGSGRKTVIDFAIGGEYEPNVDASPYHSLGYVPMETIIKELGEIGVNIVPAESMVTFKYTMGDRSVGTALPLHMFPRDADVSVERYKLRALYEEREIVIKMGNCAGKKGLTGRPFDGVCGEISMRGVGNWEEGKILDDAVEVLEKLYGVENPLENLFNR
jgi:hypothetical protein